MSLLKYEILITALKHGSLTAAAEETGYTQSAVSHMINSLEEELGVKLIRRGRAGVKLTTNGELLLPYIKDILTENDNFKQALSEVTGIIKGKLKIGAFETVNTVYLPEIIEKFLKVYPNIDIDITESTFAEVERWIENREVDCGFVSLPTKSNFQTIPVIQDRYVVCIGKGREHNFADTNAVTMEELLKEDLIMMQGKDDTDVARFFAQASVQPKFKILTDDTVASLKLVERNIGVGFMPLPLAKDYEGSINFYELKDGFSRTLAFAYLDKKEASPVTRKFIEFIEAEGLKKY